MKQTRRAWLKTVGTGGVAAAVLGADLNRIIDREEYDALRRKIKSLGHKVNKAHSQYVEGSSGVIVFLPDAHFYDYHDEQKKRITELDKAIDFEKIGLEGIVGKVNIERIEKSKSLVRRYERELFDHFESIPEEETEIYDIDLDVVKISKSGKPLLETFMELYKDKSRRRGASETRKYVQAKKDLGKLVIGIAHYNGPSFEIGDLFYDKVRDTGFAYAGHPTRAQKIGIETEERLRAALKMVHAMQTHLLYLDTSESLDRVAGFVADIGNDDLKQKYAVFSSFMTPYLERLQESRDRALIGLPADAADGLLKMDLKTLHNLVDIHDAPPSVERVLNSDRSRSWVENTLPYRTIMMIGGASHGQSLYEAAVARNVSMISLTMLDP